MKYDVEYRVCTTYRFPIQANKRKQVIDRADIFYELAFENGTLPEYEIDYEKHTVDIDEVKQ